MDLDTLAAIGEFVGGVAVVVSIGYLALQMRQNTASIRATAAIEIQRDVGSHRN